MSPSPLAGRSALSIVTDFGAHLAFLLNTGKDVMSLNAFSLQKTLLETLASTPNRRLIGAGLLEKSCESDEAAQRYFDAVMDRRLMLARANHTHKGHELFLALCCRGNAEDWSAAMLTRELGGQGNSHSAPSDFDSVASRLDRVDKSIAAGNPAATTRDKYGPLNVVVGNARAEVAEELSVWRGICCAPLMLRILEPGASFDRFCSVVIKAVEAANAPFGAILSLGLSPYDWGDELSTNTAKKLGAFLTHLKEESGQAASDGRGDLEAWRRVWKRRPVPGYASPDDLWHSPLGRALRFPVVPQAVALDELADEILQEGELLLDLDSFDDKLMAACRAGVITDNDAWLFRHVAQGVDIAEIETWAETKARFGAAAADLASYVDELAARVFEWARRLLDDHPDRGGN